ncbi:M48 family metalloprotease [Nonomuraea fuscirosea]|uniref:M48 family metalloprotease n=1 Tax=Nonomuraea fuscirosea TaxID=1291556 RepID=UPI0033C14E91
MPTIRTRPTSKPRKPQQKTFRELGEELSAKANRLSSQSGPFAMSVLFIASGFALSAVAGWPIALACWAGLVLLSQIGWAIKKSQIRRSPTIDWDGAASYEQDLLSMVHPDVADVIAQSRTAARQRDYDLHVYPARCSCGHPQDACTCVIRWSAGTQPLAGTRHVILLVGDQLMQPANLKELRFVLAHERAHLKRTHMAAHWIRMTILADVAMLTGIFSPGLTVLAGLAGVLLLHLALSWTLELACDTASAALHGNGAPGYWALTRPVRRRRAAALRWWQHPLLLTLLLMHPPKAIRLRVCAHVYKLGPTLADSTQ